MLLLLLVMVVMLLLLLLSCKRCRLSLLLLCLRWTKVRVFDQGVHIHPLILPVGEAFSYEGLGCVRHSRLVGEMDLCGLQDDVLFQNGSLRLVVAKRLKVKKKFFS